MATFTWTGHGNTGAWSDPGNWSAGGPPGAGDLALFNTGIDSQITGNATVGALEFVGAEALAFTGDITAAGIAGLAYAVTIGGNAQVGFGPGASLAAPTLEVGLNGGSSTLTMNGAPLATTSAVIGGDPTALGLVTITNALWSDAKSLVIGNTGTGALSMGPGADVFVGTSGRHGTRGNVAIGVKAGATGALDMNGGAYMYITGNMMVGGKIGAAAHGAGNINIGPNAVLDALGGAISVNDGSVVSLANGYFNAHDMQIANGALVAGSGRIIATNELLNNGEIRASGFLDVASNVSGAGTLSIGGGSTLLLEQSVLGQAAIAFLGGHATLQLDQFTGITAPIEGFAIGDAIDAAYVDHVSWDQASGVLTLLTGQTVDATLTLTGDYSHDVFKVHEVGSIGTITLAPAHVV